MSEIHLGILVNGSKTENDLNIKNIAEFLGVDTEFISLSDGYFAKKIENAYAIAISSVNFSNNILKSEHAKLIANKKILIFGIDQAINTSDFFSHFSLTSVTCKPVENNKLCQLHNELENYIPELSQYSFTSKGIDGECVLYNADKNILKPIISLDSETFFGHINKNVFLLGSAQILDINQVITAKTKLSDNFLKFAPLIIFLRFVFREKCWHSSTTYANLIIDDPFLKKRYGFVKYNELLRNMDQHNYCTTIAFIPFNYKRTEKSVASLFNKRLDRLSICYHGCDHTAGEFGTLDKEHCAQIVRLSKIRMDEHKWRSEIDCDPITVFPQGVFSTYAMKELRDQGFIAACNTSIIACNADRNSLRFRDIMMPAILQYSGLPLFSRFYPNCDPLSLRINIFLGKPILIVEHHGFFEHGYAKVEKFVSSVSSIKANIKWSSLYDAVKNAYLEREKKKGSFECKIFTNIAEITNHSENWRECTILKPDIPDLKVEAVMIDGKKSIYTIANGYIKTTKSLSPNQRIRVEVKLAIKQTDNINVNLPILYKANAILRRILCDVRDNIIATNSIANNLVNGIKRFKR